MTQPPNKLSSGGYHRLIWSLSLSHRNILKADFEIADGKENHHGKMLDYMLRHKIWDGEAYEAHLISHGIKQPTKCTFFDKVNKTLLRIFPEENASQLSDALQTACIPLTLGSPKLSQTLFHRLRQPEIEKKNYGALLYIIETEMNHYHRMSGSDHSTHLEYLQNLIHHYAQHLADRCAPDEAVEEG